MGDIGVRVHYTGQGAELASVVQHLQRWIGSLDDGWFYLLLDTPGGFCNDCYDVWTKIMYGIAGEGREWCTGILIWA